MLIVLSVFEETGETVQFSLYNKNPNNLEPSVLLPLYDK